VGSYYGKESRRSENSNKDSPKIILAIEENEDNEDQDGLMFSSNL